MSKKKNTRVKKSFNYREWLPLLISFLLPVAIMMIIFVSRGIYPFGTKSFLRTDLYHQYAPFLSEMSDKLRSGESLFYSWDIGGGTNFVAVYSYYLATPFNWLLIFVPHNLVIEFLSYLVIFKIGLAGLTFAIYLRYVGKRKTDLCLSFFAVFYALSGYTAAYSWNIMWLDCVVLFPLVMLGLEKLVKENKCLLYCISLALCILSNYYISIMICIFCVLYFIVLMICIPSTEKVTVYNDDGTVRVKKRVTFYHNKLLRFALYSLVAGGIAAITLLPEIYALQLTASTDSSFPKTLSVYFSVFEMLSRHLAVVDTHQKLDHWPNIYCGVAVLILMPMYMMNKGINYKEKFTHFILTAVMLLSFSMNIPNYIWHGFHFPNSLPGRQSFIYIALVLMMCYKGFMDIKKRSVNQIVGATSFAIAFTVLSEVLIDTDKVEEFHYWSFYASILFLAFYGLFLFMYRKRKILLPLLFVLSLALVSLEASVNTTVTSVSTFSRTAYTDYDKGAADLLGGPLVSNGYDTGVFRRFERRNLRTKNDGAWLDYPSVSTFSSMGYDGLSEFYRKWGLESSTNAYGSNGINPVTESLLGVRYIFDRETTVTDTDIYKTVGESDSVILYENLHSLGLGYMIPDTLANEYSTGTYPIENIQSFVRQATGVDSLFIKQNPEKHGKSVNFTVPEAGYYIGYVTSSAVKNVTFSCGDETETYENLGRRYLMNLEYREEGAALSFSTSDSGVENLGLDLYRLDEENYIKAMDALAEHQLVLDTWDSTYVRGQVTADEAGTLMLTVGYDPGWTVLVDGVEAQYTDLFEKAYIGVPVSAGTHTVEMKYEPQGLRYGAIISGLSVLMLIALIAFALLSRNSSKTIELVNEPSDSKLINYLRESIKLVEEEFCEGTDDPDYDVSEPAAPAPVAEVPEEPVPGLEAEPAKPTDDFPPEGAPEYANAEEAAADEPTVSADVPEEAPLFSAQTLSDESAGPEAKDAAQSEPDSVPVFATVPDSTSDPDDDDFEEVEMSLVEASDQTKKLEFLKAHEQKQNKEDKKS